MSNKYAEKTRIELEKALADKPNEFKHAVEELIKNSDALAKEAEDLREETSEVLKTAENVATNLLSLTQVIKNVFAFLGAHRDKFDKDDKNFNNLMDGLSKFVLGSTSIKAGVINANKE